MENVANKDPVIKKAVLRVMELSDDERARLLYEKREMERMDYQVGMKWAIKQKDIKTAKAMLADNEPIEKILKYTDLTRKEAEDIKV